MYPPGDKPSFNIKFDGVWWPSIYRLSRPKQTKHRPSNTRTKETIYVFDRMFDGLQILSNTI